MIDEAMEHAGALKRRLVQYGEAKQFASDLVEAQLHYFDSPEPVSSPQYVNFLDYFLLQYRLQDGSTIVDHFVSETPDLPQSDKDILMGWKNVVEGLFEILRHEGDVLVFDNLINDTVYRVRSNMGRAHFDKMRPGHFTRARIVPMGATWMLSGSISMYPPSSRNDVLRAAAEAIQKTPALMFRNPAKREEAIELQRKEKPDFIAFFGSNVVVLPVGEFESRMNAYMLHRVQKTSEDAAIAEGKELPTPLQTLPPHLRYPHDEWDKDVETVGVTYDEREGMEFHPHLGLVEEAFADPENVNIEPYRSVVSDYLQDPEISLVPLKFLAERDPERATQMIRNLLPRPDFEWQRDGENLLREYRPDYEERVLPSTIPMSERLIQAMQTPPKPAMPSVGKKVGRNEPCPCGSGKKYKQCCG